MRKRSRNREVNTDIDITAFMNLMVVLVPFLLITAVFSQLSVLELSLPTGDSQPAENPPEVPIVLEVMIYKDRFEVADRQTGPLRIVEKQGANYDYSGLNAYLKEIKAKFPKITAITILLENDTPYDLLIQTMDTVRLTKKTVNLNTINVELFPDISIGSAPPDTRNAANTTAGATP